MIWYQVCRAPTESFCLSAVSRSLIIQESEHVIHESLLTNILSLPKLGSVHLFSPSLSLRSLLSFLIYCLVINVKDTPATHTTFLWWYNSPVGVISPLVTRTTSLLLVWTDQSFGSSPGFWPKALGRAFFARKRSSQMNNYTKGEKSSFCHAAARLQSCKEHACTEGSIDRVRQWLTL